MTDNMKQDKFNSNLGAESEITKNIEGIIRDMLKRHRETSGCAKESEDYYTNKLTTYIKDRELKLGREIMGVYVEKMFDQKQKHNKEIIKAREEGKAETLKEFQFIKRQAVEETLIRELEEIRKLGTNKDAKDYFNSTERPKCTSELLRHVLQFIDKRLSQLRAEEGLK